MAFCLPQVCARWRPRQAAQSFFLIELLLSDLITFFFTFFFAVMVGDLGEGEGGARRGLLPGSATLLRRCFGGGGLLDSAGGAPLRLFGGPSDT